MSDQAQTKNPEPEQEGPARLFYTVEIRGGSEHWTAVASAIIKIALETAITLARHNLAHRRNAPEIVLHINGQGANMIAFAIFSGPGPVPAEYLDAAAGVSAALPDVLVVLLLIAMALSALYRFSERFREFWLTHVCAFMEKHGQKEGL